MAIIIPAMQGAAGAIGLKARFSATEKVLNLESARERRQKARKIAWQETWSEWQDLNLRPLRPER